MFVVGFGFHYQTVKVLKTNGYETKVFVEKKIRPRTSRERLSYVLISHNGGAFKHYSNAEYPVGEYVDIVFIPKITPHQDTSNPPLGASDSMVRGKKSDSLRKLYFSSIKDDFDDYGFTHSLCSIVSGILAIRVVIPTIKKS